MPAFRVRVVASYSPTEPSEMPHVWSAFHSEVTVKRMQDLWLSPPPGVQVGIHEGAVDAQTPTDSPLLVLTIVRDVDAPTKEDAQLDALALFERLAAERELPKPETVLPHVDDE